MLEHPDDAERYGIEWNGILLHGPPGVGKTFFARAIAGEYGLSLMHVSTGDLVGASSVSRPRTSTRRLRPRCSISPVSCSSTSSTPSPSAETTLPTRSPGAPSTSSSPRSRLTETSASCSSWPRPTRSSTSTPPSSGRAASTDTSGSIFLTPTPTRDLRSRTRRSADRPEHRANELVARTEGMTPAAIAKIVDSAALEAFARLLRRPDDEVLVDTAQLLAAIERYGGPGPADRRALVVGLADP